MVLNTTAFDGQWTRKVIEWLGFGTAQGSSTRGGLRGLAVMARRLEQGKDCGFTIDGPRGPRYVGQARSGNAGAQDRLPHSGISHRRGSRKNFYENLGPFFIAVALRARSDYLARRRFLCHGRGRLG